MTHDLLVLGAGAGGLAAARAGVRAGLRTALITDGPIGGDCTFTGCVPSKTLLAGAAAGLPASEAFARVRAVVARVAATETPEALRGEGIDVVEGRGRFLGPDSVTVWRPEPGRESVGRVVGPPQPGDPTLSAPRIVVATGTMPSYALPVARPRADGPDVLRTIDTLSTSSVFRLDDAPGSLAIVGAGPAGCELAQAFARLGTTVTLVERADRVLPGLEVDAGSVVAEALSRDGVTLRLGAAATTGEMLPGRRIRVGLESGDPVEVDQVLGVTGRRPVTHNDGYDKAGVDLDAAGFVVVDDQLATTAPGVFAVGDVTALCPHSHAADEMGRLAVRNAGRGRWRRRRFRAEEVPRVVFTDPEVATIGLSEHEAAARGEAWVAEVPCSAVDRAVIAGRESGFVRLVAAPPPGLGLLTGEGLARVGGGRLLGATIVAERAGEMIAEVALAMRIGTLTGRLAQTVHAYPTWTLAVRLAAAALATSGPVPGVTVRRAGAR